MIWLSIVVWVGLVMLLVVWYGGAVGGLVWWCGWWSFVFFP